MCLPQGDAAVKSDRMPTSAEEMILSRKDFNELTMVELANRLDRAVAIALRRRDQDLFHIYKGIAERLPDRMPPNLQEEALGMIRGNDATNANAAETVLLYMNLNNIVTAAAPYVLKLNALEHDDIMGVAIEESMRVLSRYRSSKAKKLSQDMGRKVSSGIEKYIADKYVTGARGSATEAYFLMETELERTTALTTERITKIARSISEQVPADQSDLEGYMTTRVNYETVRGRRSEQDPLQAMLRHEIVTRTEVTVTSIIKKLKPSEEYILKRRRLDDPGRATLQEVGDGFGRTRERIRQIEEKSIEKLGRGASRRELNELREGQKKKAKSKS